MGNSGFEARGEGQSRVSEDRGTTYRGSSTKFEVKAGRRVYNPQRLQCKQESPA
jgi:hypothetical protein